MFDLDDVYVYECVLHLLMLYVSASFADHFRSLAYINNDGETNNYIHFIRTAGGSTIAPEEHFSPGDAAAKEEELWDTAVEEAELLALDGAVHDQELFEQCVTSPLIFASAMLNFGVHQILDTLCEIAPAPRSRDSDAKAIETSTTAIDEVREVKIGRAHV